MQMFIGCSVIITSIGASGAVTASWPDEPRWMLRIVPSSTSARHIGSQCVVVEARVAERGRVLGERDRVAALGRDAADLVGAQLGVPQHRQRHRDDAPGIACRTTRRCASRCRPATTASARSLSSVPAKSRPENAGNDGKHMLASTPPALMSFTRSWMSKQPGRISSNDVGLTPYSSCGRPATALSPMLGIVLAVEHPDVVAAARCCTTFGAWSAYFAGMRPVEHVRRLDHVVVDADEDHVVDVHGHPRQRFSSGVSTHGSPAGRPAVEAGGSIPPVELPLTIPAVVRRAAERFGDIEGLVDGDVRLTFAELADDVDDGGAGADRVGGRARRPGRDLGAEHLGVGGHRARLPLRRRRS